VKVRIRKIVYFEVNFVCIAFYINEFALFVTLLLVFRGHKDSPSKKEKHIKWADTTGGNLERALSGSPVEPAPETDKSVNAASWSDNKKRDRLREKELLQQARYVWYSFVML
jgi:hypothetical protein